MSPSAHEGLVKGCKDGNPSVVVKRLDSKIVNACRHRRPSVRVRVERLDANTLINNSKKRYQFQSLTELQNAMSSLSLKNTNPFDVQALFEIWVTHVEQLQQRDVNLIHESSLLMYASRIVFSQVDATKAAVDRLALNLKGAKAKLPVRNSEEHENSDNSTALNEQVQIQTPRSNVLVQSPRPNINQLVLGVVGIESSSPVARLDMEIQLHENPVELEQQGCLDSEENMENGESLPLSNVFPDPQIHDYSPQNQVSPYNPQTSEAIEQRTHAMGLRIGKKRNAFSSRDLTERKRVKGKKPKIFILEDKLARAMSTTENEFNINELSISNPEAEVKEEENSGTVAADDDDNTPFISKLLNLKLHGRSTGKIFTQFVEFCSRECSTANRDISGEIGDVLPERYSSSKEFKAKLKANRSPIVKNFTTMLSIMMERPDVQEIVEENCLELSSAVGIPSQLNENGLQGGIEESLKNSKICDIGDFGLRILRVISEEEEKRGTTELDMRGTMWGDESPCSVYSEEATQDSGFGSQHSPYSEAEQSYFYMNSSESAMDKDDKLPQNDNYGLSVGSLGLDKRNSESAACDRHVKSNVNSKGKVEVPLYHVFTKMEELTTKHVALSFYSVLHELHYKHLKQNFGTLYSPEAEKCLKNRLTHEDLARLQNPENSDTLMGMMSRGGSLDNDYDNVLVSITEKGKQETVKNVQYPQAHSQQSET